VTAREIFDETEIFTEALGASVAQGNLTVAQIKRQLEDGLAYVETQGADSVAEELLVALAALDKVIQRVTGPVYNLGADRFPAGDARSVTAPATLPGASPTEAESAKAGFKTRRARSGCRAKVSNE